MVFRSGSQTFFVEVNKGGEITSDLISAKANRAFAVNTSTVSLSRGRL